MTPPADPRGHWITSHTRYVPYTDDSPLVWVCDVRHSGCTFCVDSPDSWVEDFACEVGQTVRVPHQREPWTLTVHQTRPGFALVSLQREEPPCEST